MIQVTKAHDGLHFYCIGNNGDSSINFNNSSNTFGNIMNIMKTFITNVAELRRNGAMTPLGAKRSDW